MIRNEIRALKTGPAELRKFGLMVGGVLLLLDLCFFWWRGKPHWLPALVPGIALTLIGAALPRALKFIYIAWMSLAFILGWTVSTVLLTVFYYAVVTPIGLIARLLGNDFLRRRFDPLATTYWVKRDGVARRETRNYEQQF